MIVKTARNKTVDISSILANNEDTVALGNANMNARGDIIGKGGKVIRKREDVAMDYHKNSSTQVKRISIADMDDDFFTTPNQVAKSLKDAPKAKVDKKDTKGAPPSDKV